MYILKLDAESKSMTTTSFSAIYQGENLADTLVFLLPQTVGDVVVANCKVFVSYVRPDGVSDIDELVKDPSDYKDYHQYHFPIGSQFTASVGKVKMSMQLRNTPDIVLKTAMTTIEVLSPGDVGDMSSQVSAIYKLSKRIDDLEANKADNIFYDEEEDFIQLSAEGVPIGDKVTATAIVDGGNEVIEFGGGEPIPPEEDDDGIIEF